MERTQVTVEIQRLNKEAIDSIMLLQQKVVEALEDKSIYVASSEEEIEDILSGAGIIIGGKVKEKLVAYFIAWFPKMSPKNLGLDIGLKQIEREKVVHFESVVVDPAYRGHKLQKRLMQSLLAEIQQLKFGDYMMATVSPYNIYSLKNFLDEGFYIVCIKEKYGQLLRCILLKSLQDSHLVKGKHSEGVNYRDIATQKLLLNQGYLGSALHIGGDKSIIIYTKIE